MSSDPERHVAGDLGEGAGIDRDDPNLKEADLSLDEAINVEKPQEKKKPLIVIGKFSKIRCHRCGTSKGLEDRGVWQQVDIYMVWFHDKECSDLWNVGKEGNFKTGALIDEFGNEL